MPNFRAPDAANRTGISWWWQIKSLSFKQTSSLLAAPVTIVLAGRKNKKESCTSDMISDGWERKDAALGQRIFLLQTLKG